MARAFKACLIDGCNGDAHAPGSARGWCTKHYQRWQSHGDPLTTKFDPQQTKRINAWLEQHADYAGDDCLKWPFRVNDHGRGMVTLAGVQMTAPRAMCTLAHGKPPTPEHETAHNCGKGHEGCINPRHLRWDTAAGNQADKVLHGTIIRGEAVNTAKLTEDQVREIRRIGSTMARKETAAMFEVSYWTIWEIQTRRSWAWLD
jgi:hypothetical protein